MFLAGRGLMPGPSPCDHNPLRHSFNGSRDTDSPRFMALSRIADDQTPGVRPDSLHNRLRGFGTNRLSSGGEM
jgi:hypothetical protein